jgi:serine/threonine protein kinase
MAATNAGVILGTAAYMSPEQARGKQVDKRTDRAFGCVLYELLTGKPVFHGEDVTEILASIVKSEPDWMALPADTPPVIRALLRRCLRKDAQQRRKDAGDIRIEIVDTRAAASSASANGRGASRYSSTFPLALDIGGRSDRRPTCGLCGLAIPPRDCTSTKTGRTPDDWTGT